MSRTSLFGFALFACTLFSSSVSADWEATGTFQYTDRLYNLSGWTGTQTLPIRRADVQVFDTVTFEVLGSSSTDENGSFVINVSDNATRDVGVRVLASTVELFGQNFQVVDDMNSNAVYSYHDVTTDVLGHGPTQDVFFGSMLLPPSIGDPATTDWSSQVFNCFDMAVNTSDWIAFVDGAPPSVSLTLRWNPTNGRGGSFYNGGSNTVSVADDDGYDDANVLHELGHFVEDEFGRSRNTGGFHTGGDDDQDPRLAWSEGYATYVSSAVIHFSGGDRPDVYSDRNSFGTNGGFAYSFESSANGGATQERAVTAALHDLIDGPASLDASAGSDDDPLTASGRDVEVWAVTEEMRVRNLPATNLEDFWEIWFDLGLGNQAPMESVFTDHQIDFVPDPNEPNDDPASATLIGVGAGPVENSFYRMGPDATGDEDWFRFVATGGTYYRIEVDGSSNSLFGRPDPEMVLLDLEGAQILATSQDPYDTSLNNQNSSTAQDMDETVPQLIWRAPASGEYFLHLRHATFALQIMEYGSYRVRVETIASPTPDIEEVSATPMRPGQTYQILVRGDDYSTGAQVSSSSGIVVLESRTISPQVVWARVAVDLSVAAGSYPLTVSNPAAGADTLSAALEVSETAAPPVVITELEVGGEDRVELRNLGTIEADLTGWQVYGRTTGAGLDSAYEFGSFFLAPGASVIVSEGSGTDTATEVFDNAGLFNWQWNFGSTGDVGVLDPDGRCVDYLRLVRGFVTTHQAPGGTGMVWMQPEIKAPSSGSTLARSESTALYRTTFGLSEALPTLPQGEAGRENAVDPWEDNDSPRRAPIFAGTERLDNLAISPRASGEDVDWFCVALQAGEELAVRAAFEHAQGDLQLEVYAPGTETMPLASSGSGTDDEFVHLSGSLTQTVGGGLYRVRVFGAAGAFNSYELDIVGSPDPTDCDGSGVADQIEIELGLVEDCDGSGTPDACDLASGAADDCNANNIPDFCDIADGTSLDLDASGVPDECEVTQFSRGDCNDDGGFDIADAVRLLGFLFPGPGGAAPLECEDSCDANDDGSLDIADSVRILDALFGMPATPLVMPHPACGEDPSGDGLLCEESVCP